MDDAVVSNGTLPTDPLYVTTFAEMAESRKAKEVSMSDARYAAWNLWGKIKHLVGWHTYVPMEVWDTDNGSCQYVGMTCWHCDRTIR